ncbi:lysine--tRNA ligase [Candidatus Woesearchaeota archaeon]|nr:lysine--tRNA ligase [Candidatus Woesearchaeota archaeon]
MAEEIIARTEANPELKKLVDKHGYYAYDEKTPSGEIHIGSARGWVIHDILAKCLRNQGKKAKFVLSSDDMDPFDKPIKEKPEWNKYLGVPFRNMPNPEGGKGTWAEYYFSQSTNRFPEWGIDAELESTGEEYEKGVFNAAIKTALDNTDKIAAIFERIYEKPYDKLPFNPICEKCGKIGTTVATAWNKEKELVSYECRKDAVKWAEGCGHKGEMKPYDGKGKLPWKVEWPAKWVSKGVIVETAGKDHFTKKGSRTVGIAISDEVFDYEPPYPSTRKREGPGYEFINVGGRKMSTSKGMGHGFSAMSDHVPPQILRFLMVTYKPYSVIDFDPTRGNDLLLLYDRYDTAERIYFGAEESKRAEELKRVYELSHVGPIPKKLPPQIGLRHAAVIVQIAKNDKEGIKLLQREGSLPPKLNKEQEHYLATRFAGARQWLAEFAPESDKFKIQETVSENVKKTLSKEQKEAIALLAAKLKEKEYEEKELFNEFYIICEQAGIKNTEFFKGVYLTLLTKERGPKLANLILSIGQKRVSQLLSQA